MATTRDLARTREALLAAARAEFAAHGFAGARCGAIARRARVNPRMIFYCFGSKENLYREILRCKFTMRAAFLESSPEDLAGAILHWYEAGANDLEWVRLLEWEALSTSAGKLVGEDERRRYLDHALGRLRAAQSRGLIPAGLDVAQLHLSMIALTVFPLAFPQMTRLATGLDPTDPRFQRKRVQFLRWLGERLALEPTMPAKARRPRSVAHGATRPAKLKS